MEGEVIVRFRPGLSESGRDAMVAQSGSVLEDVLPVADTVLVHAHDNSAARVTASMSASSSVVWAEPNQLVHATVEQTYRQEDPYWPRLWGLENFGEAGGSNDADIDAAAAWSVTKGAGITVGVIDSGVDAGTPDLSGKIVPGANFVADGHTTTADGHGHGTHVAGTIAALENSIGVVGAAPQALVQPLRALDDNGTGTTASLAAALASAGQRGLRVVNASVGTVSPSKALSDAIAASPNTLFVVAAGNAGGDLDGGGTPTYPCQFPNDNILCVGASDLRDGPAPFSNRGRASVDVFAPGVSIPSTIPAGAYGYQSGTSMAAPHAAATAALVASLSPAWTPLQVKNHVLETADHPMALRGLSVTSGRVNAARATGVFVGSDGMAPERVTGLKATSGVGAVSLSWSPVTASDVGIYQVEWIKNGEWTQRASVANTSANVFGLPLGMTHSFRIRAIDRSGAEAEASDVVTITTLSSSLETPRTVNAGEAETLQAGDQDAGDLASITARDIVRRSAKISALRGVVRRGRAKAVRFRLAAPARVTISATPVGRKIAGRRAPAKKRLSLDPGARTVPLNSKAKGLALTRGAWRVTVSTSAGKASVTVRIA